MRTTTHLGRRMAALFATGALAASLGLVLAPAAQAAVSLGNLTITPATGTEATGLAVSMPADCPLNSTGIVGYMSGPGITEMSNGTAQSVIQSNRAPATSFQVSGIFRDVFQANAIAAPSGTFTVRMACIGADFFTEVGEFAQTVVFTPRGGTNNANYAAQAPAKPATSTSLAVPTPADPVVQGTSVTLNATVTSGSGTPAGGVQFKAGATNLGAAVPLTAGSAALSTTAIPAGTQNLTAVYVPGANEFAASTSAGRPFIVAGPTTTTGTNRVGVSKTCTAVTGGTRTYSWLKNGVATGITTATTVVPASWLNANISCALTSTKDAVGVTRTSTAVKITAGVAPVAKVRPKVLGTMRVGRLLTCAKGTWAPTPTRYKYQWLRAGRPITGKVASTYRIVRVDKGKLLSCRVSALKTGHLTGVATGPARKVT